MIIKSMAVGPIMANCYIVGCEQQREAVIIDPGADADDILAAVKALDLTVKYIINTHGHFDHVGANAAVKESTGAPLMIHAHDAPMLAQLTYTAAAFGLRVDNSPPPDQTIDDGDTISFGQLKLTVIHTPGHSPGGICLAGAGHVFVGDTLFAGSIGRTDLPGGDFDTLIKSIQQRLFSLDGAMVVHTGHGPDTSIAQEKMHNPFAAMG